MISFSPTTPDPYLFKEIGTGIVHLNSINKKGAFSSIKSPHTSSLFNQIKNRVEFLAKENPEFGNYLKLDSILYTIKGESKEIEENLWEFEITLFARILKSQRGIEGAADPQSKIRVLLRIEDSVPEKQSHKTIWKKDGLIHRLHGPAEEYDDGSWNWREYGLLHREDGPARKYPDGTLEWFYEGKLHRQDGPARVMPHGRQEWWNHGKLHRENGPAIIHHDGTEQYYIEGKEYTLEEFLEVKTPKKGSINKLFKKINKLVKKE